MKSTIYRKSKRTIATTELARNFGDYLAQVRFGRSTYIIEKNNKPVAELRPLSRETCTLREFVEQWNATPRDPSLADDLERVNRSDRPAKNPWP